jgi:MFS family permease
MSRLAPLRVGAFRRYLTGQLLSVSGSWVQVVALTSFVVQQDRQALGVVVALQFLPMLAAPLFGAVSDRVDRRRLVMAAEVGLGGVAIVYAALALLGTITVGWIAVVAVVWGTINALDTPARQAFLTDLVPVTVAPQAGPLTGLVYLTGMTLGSVSGAVLFDRVGLAACFLVNAATFFLDVAIVRSIRLGPRPAGSVAVGARAVREGFRHVRTTPAPRAALGALAITATFTFTFPVSVPLLAASFEPSAVGAFMAAAAAGSLAVMLAAVVRRQGGALAVGRCALGLGMATGAVALAPSMLGAMVAVAAMGAAWSLFLTAVLVRLYQETSPPMMGRVMAIFGMLLIGSTPVGGPIAGALAEAAGARTPFVIGALAAFAAAALAWTLRAATASQPAVGGQVRTSEALL